MLILAQFDGTRWIAILLSEDGDPSGDGLDRKAPGAPANPAPTKKPASSSFATEVAKGT
jgi:AI-2 transport protein TqsA